LTSTVNGVVSFVDIQLEEDPQQFTSLNYLASRTLAETTRLLYGYLKNTFEYYILVIVGQ